MNADETLTDKHVRRIFPHFQQPPASRDPLQRAELVAPPSTQLTESNSLSRDFRSLSFDCSTHTTDHGLEPDFNARAHQGLIAAV